LSRRTPATRRRQTGAGAGWTSPVVRSRSCGAQANSKSFPQPLLGAVHSPVGHERDRVSQRQNTLTASTMLPPKTNNPIVSGKTPSCPDGSGDAVDCWADALSSSSQEGAFRSGVPSGRRDCSQQQMAARLRNLLDQAKQLDWSTPLAERMISILRTSPPRNNRR
jgi:hypothetical protein